MRAWIYGSSSEEFADVKDLRFAKFVLLVNGLAPGTLLLWDACHGQVGANLMSFALRTTGILALETLDRRFPNLNLTLTPIRGAAHAYPYSHPFRGSRLMSALAFSLLVKRPARKS